MDFERVTAESLGIRSEDILHFLEEERRAGIELHSFMLVRQGKVAAEGWYAPYSSERRHIIYSFSKTFTATAVGFAWQEGLLSLDEKLVDLFPDELPEKVSENLAQADIRSLLTMSCGHAMEITREDIAASGNNWVRAFFAQDFCFKPGTVFQYNTYGTDLLCLILWKKTGMTLTRYLNSRLFRYIGIRDVYCSKMEDRLVPPGSPYGQVEGGGWGFHMRTEDLARFIWFVEQRGVWDGERLLKEEWFDQAVSKQIDTLNDVYGPVTSNWQQGYCFQCWCNTYRGSFRADGAYGQFGYVIPRKDTILITTACAINTEDLLNIFVRTIVEKMQDLPLPEDPAADRALKETCASLKLTPLAGLRNMWTEKILEGSVYHIQNPSGISLEEFIGGEGHFGHDDRRLESIEVHFGPGETDLVFEEILKDGSRDRQKLSVGLDGDLRQSVLSDGIYEASGRWLAVNEMELEVRFYEALGAARIFLRFENDGLTMTAGSQVPEENWITYREATRISGKKVNA